MDNFEQKESDKVMNKKNKQKSAIWEAAETGVYVILAIVLTYLIITYVGQRTVVDGSSMNPTLTDGDNIIVDKLSYRFHEPERFDIIVFPHTEYGTTVFYIKRIIGLPGETIQIKDGKIYIDDEILDENYGKEVMLDAGYAAEPIQLGDDEYFVLGDNRNQSKDSRHLDSNNNPDVGLIKRDDIVGKAWLRFWPFKEFGILKHK